MGVYLRFFFGDTEWVSPNGFNYDDRDFDLGVAPTINIAPRLPPPPQVIFRDNLGEPQVAIPHPGPNIQAPIQNPGPAQPRLDGGIHDPAFDPQPGGIVQAEPRVEGPGEVGAPNVVVGDRFNGIPDWVLEQREAIQDPDPRFEGIPNWFFGGEGLGDVPNVNNDANFEPQPGGVVDPDPNFDGIPGWFIEGGDNPGIDIGDGFRINLDPAYEAGPGLFNGDNDHGVNIDYDSDFEAEWDFAPEVDDWNK